MLDPTVETTEDILLWKSNQLEMLLEVGNTLALTHDMTELFQKIVDGAAQLMNRGSAAIYLLNHEGLLNLEATFPSLPDDFPEAMKRALVTKHPHIYRVLSTMKESVLPDTRVAHLTEEELLVTVSRDLRSLFYIPLCNQGRAIGVLIVGSVERVHEFTQDEIDIFHALANMAALEIERTRLSHERQAYIDEIEEHIQQQERIKKSLSESEQRYRHLAENALDIIYRIKVASAPKRHQLEYISPSVQNITGYTQEDFEDRPDLVRDIIHPVDYANLKKLSEEIHGTEPLTTLVKSKQGKLVWLEHRITPQYDQDGLLAALEGIARDITERKQAEEELCRVYDELNHAYEETIESLAKGLELRDYETEGHSRRVVELTLQLARELGVPEDELVTIQRGALLHDIGKIGIADAILLKPGPLTEDEWEIMRRHPKLAYDMLYTIEYLRPSLEIPLYHHEKFDGSGYPFGKKGEEIPLAARMFSVVDVYDALTSDRPYRKAWTKADALKYIEEQSGRHFDPRIVDAFLTMEKNTCDPDDPT
ncbi:MAG: HD domain-containing protein [Firmicutes bacterium]|nr:HD domain-containing protein [Bacillota bacterium]